MHARCTPSLRFHCCKLEKEKKVWMLLDHLWSSRETNPPIVFGMLCSDTPDETDLVNQTQREKAADEIYVYF